MHTYNNWNSEDQTSKNHVLNTETKNMKSSKRRKHYKYTKASTLKFRALLNIKKLKFIKIKVYLKKFNYELSLQTNPLPRQVVSDFSWALISTFNLILKGEENSVLPDSEL